MSEPVKAEVPPTAYAVMALLHRGGGLSGYDVRGWALQSLRHFYWSPAQSQIYRELRRLEGLGWVASEHVSQQGRPDKTVHHLTEDGTAALAEWVRSPVVEPVQFKHPAALRLFSGDLGDELSTRALLEEHVAATEEQLADLEELVVGLGDEADARFARAVAEWGIEIYRADRSGAMALLARLGELYGRPDRTAHPEREE